jgi:quercetin dioxygenase-like cupin family protein
MFPLTRVYNDENGDTRFEDIFIPLKDAGEIGKLSDQLPATAIIFREVEPEYDYDFHNAPQKQYLVLIDGEIEIETTLGEKRQFKAGDVLLLEDTEGKGHRTRNLQPRKRRSVFITIP